MLDSVSLRKVRMRSPENVVDEIEMVLRVRANNARVIEICDEIVRRGIKTKFFCQGRVKPLSRELVLALERAGFVSVTLGLESGAPDVLERCNKKIFLKDVERALGLFADSPIKVSVLLIIGLPGENDHSIQETIDFCRTLSPVVFLVQRPGTGFDEYPRSTVVFRVQCPFCGEWMDRIFDYPGDAEDIANASYDQALAFLADFRPIICQKCYRLSKSSPRSVGSRLVMVSMAGGDVPSYRQLELTALVQPMLSASAHTATGPKIGETLWFEPYDSE